MKIFVTGASSHLAAALLPALCAHESVEAITGIDIAAQNFHHKKFKFFPGDILSPHLSQWMEGHDAVVHLAFVVLAKSLGKDRKKRDRIRTINIDGGRNVLAAAHQTGIAKLVYSSSVAAYGAWPDNPDFLNETHPLRPNPGFVYSEDKAHFEKVLDIWEQEHHTPRIVRLRLHAVIGPNSHGLLKLIAHNPIYVHGSKAKVQCVSEEDTIRAFIEALTREVHGAFNIASPDAIAYHDMAKANGLAIPVPYWLIEKGHRFVWRFTGALGDPGWTDGMRYPLVVDTEKARQLLHWQACFSMAEYLSKMR